MIIPNIDPAHLVFRNEVVSQLILLIQTALSYSDVKLIFLHCGLACGFAGRLDPMDFDELAEYLGFESVQETEKLYYDAIERARKAIYGSELENWILSYNQVYRQSDKPAKLHFEPLPRYDSLKNH